MLIVRLAVVDGVNAVRRWGPSKLYIVFREEEEEGVVHCGPSPACRQD